MLKKLKEASGMISAIGGAIAIIAIGVYAWTDHENDFTILVGAVQEIQKSTDQTKYHRLYRIWETTGLSQGQWDDICDLAKKLNKYCPTTKKKS